MWRCSPAANRPESSAERYGSPARGLGPAAGVYAPDLLAGVFGR
jgi:hypothetical protein